MLLTDIKKRIRKFLFFPLSFVPFLNTVLKMLDTVECGVGEATQRECHSLISYGTIAWTFDHIKNLLKRCSCDYDIVVIFFFFFLKSIYL